MAGTSANFRSRSSLTLENLESLPKNNRSVDSFITEQRRNAWFYASEALSVIDQPSAITSKPKTNYSKPNRFTSPLLKSRLEMQRGLSDADATPPIRKKSQQKELFKGFKHAREDRTERKISQKATNKSKRPRSSSDDEEEHSARECIEGYQPIFLMWFSRPQRASSSKACSKRNNQTKGYHPRTIDIRRRGYRSPTKANEEIQWKEIGGGT